MGDFTPFQVAVAASSALVVLGIGLWGYEMGPSPQLIVKQRRKPADAGEAKAGGGKDQPSAVSPAAAAAAAAAAAPAAAAPAAQSGAAAASKPSAKLEKSSIAQSSASTVATGSAPAAAPSSPAQTLSNKKPPASVASSDVPFVQKPSYLAVASKVAPADATPKKGLTIALPDSPCARLFNAFHQSPSTEVPDLSITLAELEARVSRIASGLLSAGASSVVFVEWNPTNEALSLQALLAAAWIGCTGKAIAVGAPANGVVVGRGKLTADDIEACAGFCAPATLILGGKIDAGSVPRVEEMLESWVKAAAQ